MVHPTFKYNSSTFLRAHGVLRKNFRLDPMLGSCVKQRIGTAAPIAAQPMLSDSCVTIASSVTPSRAGRFAGCLFESMPAFYRGLPFRESLQIRHGFSSRADKRIFLPLVC
jgi:hypothetical protein